MITQLKNGAQIVQTDVLQKVVADKAWPLVSFGDCNIPQMRQVLRQVALQAGIDCQNWGEDILWLLKEAGFVPVVMGDGPVTLESKVVLPVHMTVLSEHDVPATIWFGLVVKLANLAAVGAAAANQQNGSVSRKNGRNEWNWRRLRQHRRPARGNFYRSRDPFGLEDGDAGEVQIYDDDETPSPEVVEAFRKSAKVPDLIPAITVS